VTKKRVLLGVPRWAYAQPEAEAWRINVAAHLGNKMADSEFPYTFDFATLPNMLVHFARDQMCQRALAGGYDFVCMVDDDMNGPVDRCARGPWPEGTILCAWWMTT